MAGNPRQRTTKALPRAEEVPQQDLASDFAHPDNECASVTINIDHLLVSPGPPKAHVVFGGDTAPEAVVNLMAYHKLSLTVADAIAIAEGCRVASAYLLYVSPELSELVIDRAFWDEVKNDPEMGNGTDMGTIGSFITLSTELKKRARQAGIPQGALLHLPSE